MINEFEPFMVVAAASKIKGSHTGITICNALETSLSRIGITRDKIHLVMRDAQSSMRLGVNLYGVESIDCFLHKIQLVGFIYFFLEFMFLGGQGRIKQL